MTIATILPTARTVFLDANNNPLSGGKVYFYIPPNTTTPKTTWQDATGSVANTNPVILDGNGSALIYGSGQYLQEVFDSLDNLIYTGLTQDVYGLIVNGNNAWTGTNTFNGDTVFNGTVTFSNDVATPGGLINKFRNPNMDVAQRGVTGTVTTGNSSYTVDGWIVGATGATITWSQIAQGSVGNIVGTYLLLQGNTSMTDTFIRQRIESTIAQQLVGERVTFQILVSPFGTGTLSPTLTVRHAGTTDNWSSPVTDINGVALQTVTTATGQGILSYTFTPDPGTKFGLEITVNFGTFLNVASQSIYLTDADIRQTPGVVVGLNSNPPTPERRPVNFEMDFCRRYLPAWSSASTTAALGFGIAYLTTGAYFMLPFTTRARTVPSGILLSSNGHCSLSDGASTFTVNASSLNAITSDLSLGLNLGVASGLTQFRPYIAYFNSTSGLLLATGCEL